MKRDYIMLHGIVFDFKDPIDFSFQNFRFYLLNKYKHFENFVFELIQDEIKEIFSETVLEISDKFYGQEIDVFNISSFIEENRFAINAVTMESLEYASRKKTKAFAIYYNTGKEIVISVIRALDKDGFLIQTDDSLYSSIQDFLKSYISFSTYDSVIEKIIKNQELLKKAVSTFIPVPEGSVRYVQLNENSTVNSDNSTLEYKNEILKESKPSQFDVLQYINQYDDSEEEFIPNGLNLKYTKFTQDVQIFHKFISSEEADDFLNIAKTKSLASATVGTIEKAHSSTIVDKGARDASVVYSSFPELDNLTQKVADLLLVDRRRIETPQIVRYEKGGYYKAHHDYFNSDAEGHQVHLSMGGNRVFTAVLYLNDDFDGGETVFPIMGFKISPVKGNLLFFRNLTKDGKYIPESLHSGEPVISGEKWIIPFWVREGNYI